MKEKAALLSIFDIQCSIFDIQFLSSDLSVFGRLRCAEVLQNLGSRKSFFQGNQMHPATVGLHEVRPDYLVPVIIGPFDENVGTKCFNQSQRSRLLEDRHVIDRLKGGQYV